LVIEIDEHRFCADAFLHSESRILDRDAFLAFACDNLFSILHDTTADEQTWWLRYCQAIGQGAADAGAGVRLDDGGEDRLPIDQPPLRDGPVYQKATGDQPATFSIVTTGANELMAKIHDRMPVILERDAANRWLKRGPITADEIAALATPHPVEDMEAYPISQLVNSPKNDVPEVLVPVLPPPPEADPRRTVLVATMIGIMNR
jgi:hypothetical protein